MKYAVTIILAAIFMTVASVAYAQNNGGKPKSHQGQEMSQQRKHQGQQISEQKIHQGQQIKEQKRHRIQKKTNYPGSEEKKDLEEAVDAVQKNEQD